MTLHIDTLIIGGGISGLLTARELRLAGQDVAVIDQSQLGRESSWAGGGILLPIYPWRQSPAISALVAISLKIYPCLQRELLNHTGIDPEWQDCGMLICKNPDYNQAVSWCEHYNVTHRDAHADLTTDLQTTLDQPLWLPEIAQIRNPRLLKSLKAYLLATGVKLMENVEIRKIHSHGRQISTIETAEQHFTFKHLIICTGAWTVGFLDRWLIPAASTPKLAINPVKGQMLVFDAQPSTLSHMILDGDQYLIPRRDGRILAGSTVEYTGFDKSTSADAKQKLYDFATQLLPDLQRYPANHHWAGLRPGTPDGVPYVGHHPNYDNLSVNAGHFRNGLVMGPASAQLLADLILNRPTSINPQNYGLIRE